MLREKIVKVPTPGVPSTGKPLRMAYKGVILSCLHRSVMELAFITIDRRQDGKRVAGLLSVFGKKWGDF